MLCSRPVFTFCIVYYLSRCLESTVDIDHCRRSQVSWEISTTLYKLMNSFSFPLDSSTVPSGPSMRKGVRKWLNTMSSRNVPSFSFLERRLCSRYPSRCLESTKTVTIIDGCEPFERYLYLIQKGNPSNKDQISLALLSRGLFTILHWNRADHIPTRFSLFDKEGFPSTNITSPFLTENLFTILHRIFAAYPNYTLNWMPVMSSLFLETGSGNLHRLRIPPVWERFSSVS